MELVRLILLKYLLRLRVRMLLLQPLRQHLLLDGVSKRAVCSIIVRGAGAIVRVLTL